MSTAVEIRLYDMLHLCDPNVMRFIKEHADEKHEDTFSQSVVHLYKIHDRRYKLKLKRCPDEISMIARSAMASSLSVKLAYANGEFDCSQEECLDYLTSLPVQDGFAVGAVAFGHGAVFDVLAGAAAQGRNVSQVCFGHLNLLVLIRFCATLCRRDRSKL